MVANEQLYGNWEVSQGNYLYQLELNYDGTFNSNIFIPWRVSTGKFHYDDEVLQINIERGRRADFNSFESTEGTIIYKMTFSDGETMILELKNGGGVTSVQSFRFKRTGRFMHRGDMSYRSSSGGCYVATCVYGSYDCPEVWTLRRFRDYTLTKSWYGSLGVHLYYAISPKIVSLFGNKQWFHKLCKPTIEKIVQHLQKNGVSSKSYEDD